MHPPVNTGQRPRHHQRRSRGPAWWARPAVAGLLALTLAWAPDPARAASADGAAQALADTASADGAVRLAATESLARIWTVAARDRLMLMAQADPDPRVRISALRWLASTRDPGFRPLLQSIAWHDPDGAVRAAAEAGQAELSAFSRRPRTAGGFSLLCPGCGYFYLRQPRRAAAYLGATAALLATSVALLRGDPDRLISEPGQPVRSGTAPLAIPVLNAAQNLWFYGVFASYRDARIRRGDQGYRYPVSREELPDLLTAPFRPSVISRPWFWAALPVLLGAALGYSVLVDEDPMRGVRRLGDGGGVRFLGRRYSTGAGLALGGAFYAGLFLPVGVGEEALFRGAIQPGLTEMVGLWPGWALTSAIFGATHAFNFLGQEGGLGDAAKAVPFIAATGSYLGLVAIKTGFRLETSVALHFWYDFLLGTTAFILDPDNQPFALRFGWPF
jgi:membrane protease YdiL (CAAX protease family)